MLILEALARRVRDGEPVDGFSAKKLRSYYLLNPLEEGERGFKLLLTQTDKQSMLALIQQKPQPAEPSLRITENFAFFEEWVQGLGADLTPLCKGLAKLMIVDIALSRDQDNPQLRTSRRPRLFEGSTFHNSPVLPRSTASCCRRATFSRVSSRRALKAETRARTNDEIMPAYVPAKIQRGARNLFQTTPISTGGDHSAHDLDETGRGAVHLHDLLIVAPQSAMSVRSSDFALLGASAVKCWYAARGI